MRKRKKGDGETRKTKVFSTTTCPFNRGDSFRSANKRIFTYNYALYYRQVCGSGCMELTFGSGSDPWEGSASLLERMVLYISWPKGHGNIHAKYANNAFFSLYQRNKFSSRWSRPLNIFSERKKIKGKKSQLYVKNGIIGQLNKKNFKNQFDYIRTINIYKIRIKLQQIRKAFVLTSYNFTVILHLLYLKVFFSLSK